jgi:hypothetical protein
MSTRNLIDAIASGSALDIESAFEDTMAEKVSVQIEAKRLQIAQTMFTTEESELDEEQLDELSKDTLGSYVRKAKVGAIKHLMAHEFNAAIGNIPDSNTHKKIANKRYNGVVLASKKLTKEEVEEQTEQE